VSQSLVFSICVPSDPVAAAAKVVLNMEIENQGNEPIYVNARFAVVPEFGDIRPTIRLDGQTLPFKFRVRLAPLKNGDFLLLEPGERTVAGCCLSKGFDLSRPGTYEISAEYVNEVTPAGFQGKAVFQGRLKSEQVRLVVHR
jgi:hypothetical protein